MKTMPRVTQRAPLSCYPCSKRKMRCSKTIPCLHCVRRGIPEQCVREAVILTKTLPGSPLKISPSQLEISGETTRNGTSGPVAYVSNGAAQRPSDVTCNSSNHPDLERILSPTPLPIETVLRPGWNLESTSLAPEYSSLRRQSGSRPAGETDTSQRPSEPNIEVEAANNLETLSWGSHQGLAETSRSRNWALRIRGSLTAFQERDVLEFHRIHVAWTHNVLHMPTFIQECQLHRQTPQSLPKAAWLVLYYAVLSLSFMYMGKERADRIGLPDLHLLSQSFYELALESMHAAELATSNSIHLLQAICVILPCCHAFGDGKRIIVLLAMANAAAQMMNLHRLEPSQQRSWTMPEIIDREIKKRVWCFLCIQDHYLTTFKRSYSIVMAHCTTPPPANCFEEDVAAEVPVEWFTQCTYQRLLFDMTNIARALFDNVASLEKQNCDMSEIFEKVLEADTNMNRLAWDMRYWLRAQSTEGSGIQVYNTESAGAVIENVRRTMRISFCHKRIAIHRSFFCRSLADRRFHYSYSTCLDSARTILQEVTQSCTKPFEIDCWTIPAHAISACIIIMLKTVFSRCFIMDELSAQSTQDQDLMENCLNILRPLKDRNKIVERGMTMIQRLIDSKYEPERTYTALDSEEMARLVREVEEKISAENGMEDISCMAFSDGIFMLFDE
ncbi:uncharacterized protein PV09_08072 [Verruconis gallopava]|uniref:Zn(2)-C6 fungal-type domain-containing protein n=1 Tax=Verruconis gallopava TaxID=253628 RepID=A0A0D2AMJ8_9PEZI|nr:uncharacterized protein PV09_08072 [Verruconis gallopava]KIW00359.1 hypothetical protein PV09_08072 [Verruconis gallopava]